MPGPLDFLSGPPSPVERSNGEWTRKRPLPSDVLPQSVADQLLGLDGVDGVWIERDAAGQRFVCLHYSRPDQPLHLPGTVQGMMVKVVGGEPIRTQR